MKDTEHDWITAARRRDMARPPIAQQPNGRLIWEDDLDLYATEKFRMAFGYIVVTLGLLAFIFGLLAFGGVLLAVMGW